MASCGSLQHLFENPLPENPTLMETLSWNQIKAMKPLEPPAFTEIFGELHFDEKKPESPPNSAVDRSPPSDSRDPDATNGKNPESLQLCTEGLGFESLSDVEDLGNEAGDGLIYLGKEKKKEEGSARRLNDTNVHGFSRRGDFPPPISCIGRGGKPWVCFKSYREGGRFVLREIRIPTQEFLHACREDGRLKLHFVQPDEKISGGEEPEEEEEDEEEEEEEDEEDEDDDDDEEETELGEGEMD